MLKRILAQSTIAWALFVGAGLTICAGAASAIEVELAFIPSSEDECEDLYGDADSPESALAAFIAAMVAYEDDKEIGLACMVMGLDDNNLRPGDTYDDKSPEPAFLYLVEVGIEKDPNIARSYFDGATQQNGYELPDDILTLYMSRNRLSNISDTEVRVYVETSGQPTDRPARMHQDDEGVWKVYDASSLFVGIYKPSDG